MYPPQIPPPSLTLEMNCKIEHEISANPAPNLRKSSWNVDFETDLPIHAKDLTDVKPKWINKKVTMSYNQTPE